MIWITGGNYIFLAFFALYNLLCFLFKHSFSYGSPLPQLYSFEQRGKVEGNQAVRNDWAKLSSTMELFLLLCPTTKPQVQNFLVATVIPPLTNSLNICFPPVCFSYRTPTVPSIILSPLQQFFKGLLHKWRKYAMSHLEYKNLWIVGQTLFFAFCKLI